MNRRFYYLLMVFALVTGCSTKNVNEQASALLLQGPIKTGKTMDVYKLAKLDKDSTYNIDDDTISGIASSKDGRYLYLIGSDPSTVLAYESAGLTKEWSNIAPTWKGIRQADNAQDFYNMHGSVTHFAPSSDGIFLWVKDKGAIQVKGLGGMEASVAWKKINGEKINASAITVIEKGGEEFFYISAESLASNKVFFRKKQALKLSNEGSSYMNDNWMEIAADKQYKQMLFNDKQELLMLSTDGLCIDSVNDANVAGEHAYIDKETFDQVRDNPVRECAQIKQYLLCGFIKTGEKTGGLAVYDASTAKDIKDPQSWKWLDKSQNINKIDVDMHDKLTKNERAIISTDNGFMIFAQGGLVLNSALTSARPTFIGDSLPSNAQSYIGAAQDKEGRWYIAIKGGDDDDGGIYTLEIAKKMF